MYKNEPQNGTRNWTPQKAAFLRKKNPVFQKGDQNGSPKGGTLWSARLFHVASLFFARFLGLPSLLWTIICPHFRALGLDFLVFSRLRFQDFGANETHPIHTHKPTIFIFHKDCPLRAGGDARSVRNFSEKKKAWPADEDLSFWIGPGHTPDKPWISGHVQNTTFPKISHVSGPEITF